MSIQESFEKYKILIVDSNTENCNLLSQIISPHYEVITASPQEAFDVISENFRDIATAIIEIRQATPILEKLRGSIPTSKFPVLISTDIDNSELENKLLDLDVTDFLKKPFDKRRVLNRLKTAIKLSQANKAIDELERDELTGLLREHQDPALLFWVVLFWACPARLLRNIPSFWRYRSCWVPAC